MTNVVANPGDTQVSSRWTNPLGAFDAIKVVRKAGGAPADPTDGTVVYNGTGTSVTDAGPDERHALPLRDLGRQRHAALAPSRARARRPSPRRSTRSTNLQATPGDLQVDLSWTNPTTPFDQIKVVRKAGAAPADPTDGTVVYSGTGHVARRHRPDERRRLPLRASGRSAAARSRPPCASTATPVAPPLVTVTNLQATAGNGSVDLSWTNPTIRFDQVVGRPQGGRRPGRPDRRHDGLQRAPARRSTDTGLTNGTTYHYAVFVSRDGQFSTAGARQRRPRSTRRAPSPTPPQPTGAYGGTARLRPSARSSTSPTTRC